jgi:hypothetical protein
VRAGAALAEGQRPEHLAARHPLQELGRALTAAAGHGRRGHRVHQVDHAGRRAGGAHGLAGLDERGQAAAGSTVLLRHEQPERPGSGEGGDALGREGATAIDVGRGRRDLRIDDIAK